MLIYLNKILTIMNFKRIKRNLKWTNKFSFKPVVVSAGMPRSGSTLLYNIIREILGQRFKNLASGWIDDINQFPKGDSYLIKTHWISKYLIWRSKYIFYTFRDLRDVAVSAQRKFDRPVSIEKIKVDINEYLKAKKYSDMMIKYELMMQNPIEYIDKISDILDVTVDSDSIYNKVMSIKPPINKSGYSKKTLLHNNHITNTKRGEWREIYPQATISAIHNEFGWWFAENEYPLK